MSQLLLIMAKTCEVLFSLQSVSNTLCQLISSTSLGRARTQNPCVRIWIHYSFQIAAVASSYTYYWSLGISTLKVLQKFHVRSLLWRDWASSEWSQDALLETETGELSESLWNECWQVALFSWKD